MLNPKYKDSIYYGVPLYQVTRGIDTIFTRRLLGHLGSNDPMNGSILKKPLSENRFNERIKYRGLLENQQCYMICRVGIKGP